ncbi:MAG: hypothetical protein AB3X44_02055 [Leptothrix sp. (in: b-proteobacteria)]
MCPIPRHSPRQRASGKTPPWAGLLLSAALGLGAGLGAPDAASAQTRSTAALLADPTRPPTALVGSPRTGSAVETAGVATSHGGAAAAAHPVQRPIAPPQLQALQRPRDDSPPSALVDGRWLHIGDRLGDWTVQTIGADAVWLRHTRGTTQRLALLPAMSPSGTPSSPAGAEEPLHLAATAAASAHTVIRKEP